MRVAKDKVVTIEYTMKDDRGNVVDTTDDGDPLSFIQGRESVFPAIEAAVEGHDTGARVSVVLEPPDAYGYRDESLVRKVSRDRVNFPGELKVGLRLKGRKRPEASPFTIVAFDDESVTLDGNNPLAGVTLEVDLVVVEVRDAIEAELEAGRVQERPWTPVEQVLGG